MNKKYILLAMICIQILALHGQCQEAQSAQMHPPQGQVDLSPPSSASRVLSVFDLRLEISSYLAPYEAMHLETMRRDWVLENVSILVNEIIQAFKTCDFRFANHEIITFGPQKAREIMQDMMTQINALASTPRSTPVIFAKVFNVLFDATHLNAQYLKYDPVFLEWRKKMIHCYASYVQGHHLTIFKPLNQYTFNEILARAPYLRDQDKTRIAEWMVKKLYCFTFNPDVMTILGAGGWERAQEYIVDGYAYGLYDFPKNFKKLLELAERGWKPAQKKVAYGYTYGQLGFTQDPEMIIDLAERGWKTAQERLALGYATGYHGFQQNSLKLLELAERGWLEAQRSVALGYDYGIYNAPNISRKLLKFAKRGWAKPDYIIDYDSKIPCKKAVFEYAKQGDRGAQCVILEGYFWGKKLGLQKDLNKLWALADCGWDAAQETIIVTAHENEHERIIKKGYGRWKELYCEHNEKKILLDATIKILGFDTCPCRGTLEMLLTIDHHMRRMALKQPEVDSARVAEILDEQPQGCCAVS
ncbi:MAG: hypothetical protein Q8K36_05045 [Alphaproteobacteria bacterium]|nr:hypothetical protein [Alphaproteobacteria bacterium]